MEFPSIKQQNRQQIFRYIQENAGVSRQDIAYALKLSLQTVISNLDYLSENHLIVTTDVMKSTGGRKANTYQVNANAKAAIGLYLTDYHINAVAVNLDGEVICARRVRRKFDLNSDEYLQELSKIVEIVKDAVGIAQENLLGVGISLPGLLSEDNETVRIGASMKFTGKTRSEITKYISCRNRLVHDSYAEIFAETWHDEKTENAFYIGLNNHIGGGAVINGQVYSGTNNKSGEIGHLPSFGRKTCYCGKAGCFETVCAATVLSDAADGDLEQFFVNLQSGDAKAKTIWHNYLKNLARAINIIRLMYDCDVIIGGLVGTRIAEYMDQLCDLVDANAFFDDQAHDYLKQCKYTTENVGAGAALLFVDEYINSI